MISAGVLLKLDDDGFIDIARGLRSPLRVQSSSAYGIEPDEERIRYYRTLWAAES